MLEAVSVIDPDRSPTYAMLFSQALEANPTPAGRETTLDDLTGKMMPRAADLFASLATSAATADHVADERANARAEGVKLVLPGDEIDLQIGAVRRHWAAALDAAAELFTDPGVKHEPIFGRGQSGAVPLVASALGALRSAVIKGADSPDLFAPGMGMGAVRVAAGKALRLAGGIDVDRFPLDRHVRDAVADAALGWVELGELANKTLASSGKSASPAAAHAGQGLQRTASAAYATFASSA